MERVYEEAFCEVDEIIKLMPIDLKSKIPIQFTDIIEKNKASNYKVEIQEPLQEQQLKEETITILGLIYRDFLASPEEKERLQRQDAEKLKQLEQEITEQYDMQNVFANKKKKKISSLRKLCNYSLFLHFTIIKHVIRLYTINTTRITMIFNKYIFISRL